MEQQLEKILFRYFIGMVIAIITLFIPLFYYIFRPLTIWPTVFVLKFFYEVSLIKDTIVINGIFINLIDACIAGSAYFLLFILNILTYGIDFRQRLIIFIFDSCLLLLMNILRLVILIVLIINKSLAFDITHKVFWYGVSTIYVVLIWVFTIFIFRIKKIPFVSDVKFILSKKKIKRF